MRAITNAIIIIMSIILVALGVFGLLVKYNIYQTNNEYALATRGSVNASYENKYLELIEINPNTDYNIYGKVHISTIISYNIDDETIVSQVIGHENGLLVLQNGETIENNLVNKVARSPEDIVLQVVNVAIKEEVNFYMLTGLASLILIYGLVLIFVRKKPVTKQEEGQVVTTDTPKEVVVIQSEGQIKHEYSEVDKIVMDFMESNQIKLTSQSFKTNVSKLTSAEIISYIDSKNDIEKNEGVGKKPTSFKIKNKKAFIMVYPSDTEIKITFKASPLLGEELISLSKGLVTKSSFPHGSVWFTISNTKDIATDSLKQLIDIAYELAYHKI